MFYGYGYKVINSSGTIINLVLDNFDDGTTFMTLGLIEGVLSLWYTQTDEVINTWDNE